VALVVHAPDHGQIGLVVLVLDAPVGVVATGVTVGEQPFCPIRKSREAMPPAVESTVVSFSPWAIYAPAWPTPVTVPRPYALGGMPATGAMARSVSPR
jgi:hypothetical protein